MTDNLSILRKGISSSDGKIPVGLSGSDRMHRILWRDCVYRALALYAGG